MPETPKFSDDTYRNREARVRAMMAGRGIEALIVYALGSGQNANVEYLAGTVPTNSVLFFPAVGDPVVFVQPKALVPFASRLARYEVRNGGNDYSDELIDQIASRGLDRATIGLVEIDSLRTRGIPHLLYQALRDRFPAARFDTVTEQYERVRSILAPEELAWADRAANELDQVIDYFVGQFRPGATPAGIIAETKQYAQEQGLALSALSCRGAAMDGSTSIMDPASTTRPLRAGDYVFFESNALFGSYRAYRGFPIALGDPPADCRNLFDTALDVAKLVAERLRPGGTTSEVAAAGDLVIERGLWCHGPLASLSGAGGWQMICVRGFDGYRAPAEITFEPGMAFSAFPHLCLPDHSKITILGNTVVVGETAPRILGAQGLRWVVQ